MKPSPSTCRRKWARPTSSRGRAKARSVSPSPRSSDGSPPAPRPSTSHSGAARNAFRNGFGRRSSVSRGWPSLAETLDDVPEDDDDLNADEQETLEEKLVDQATAAKTIAELEDEILILVGARAAGKDRGRLGPGSQMGGTLEAACRTTPRCTTPPAGSGSSSSSPSIATR